MSACTPVLIFVGVVDIPRLGLSCVSCLCELLCCTSSLPSDEDDERGEDEADEEETPSEQEELSWSWHLGAWWSTTVVNSEWNVTVFPPLMGDDPPTLVMVKANLTFRVARRLVTRGVDQRNAFLPAQFTKLLDKTTFRAFFWTFTT